MEQLKGYRTYIVFGIVLLNGILNLFGWGLELPAEWQELSEILLALAALFLRKITTSPAKPLI